MKKKSLSAKKIIPEIFNFKKILKNKKIYENYISFLNNFKNYGNSKKVAISVSGGPDSLALCFLISYYNSQTNNKIKPFFYLIDHGLRKNSEKEARQVKKHLKLKKIDLKILKWVGKKPKSNLQSLARQKRYSLLFEECKKNNINIIVTAHHQDDFYETFFSRLLRGSGTEGLSSFAEIESKINFKGSSFKIVRPLLNLNKEKLTYITKNVFNFYVNDPSNEMDKFQRVRIRKLISNLKNEGLDFHKLNLTLNNLSSTNKAINEIVGLNIIKNAIFKNKTYIINSNFFLFPDEVVFRSLSKLIKNLNGKDYAPRGRKMTNLIKNLKDKEHFKATLGGTIIKKLHNSVIVIKEKRKKGKFATI